MTGSVAISIGSLILIGGAMNRSEGRQRTMLHGLFLYVGGIVVMHAWSVRLRFPNRRDCGARSPSGS